VGLLIYREMIGRYIEGEYTGRFGRRTIEI